MFNRFRDSLVYPRRIINYRKDKMIRVIGYMMLFALLMLSSTIVVLAQFERIPQTVREMYQENLSDAEINCILDDGTLTCDEEPVLTRFYSETIGLVSVSMGVSDDEPTASEISTLGIDLFFSNEVVYLYYAGIPIEYTYDQLPDEFSSIDFSQSSTDPNAFTDVIMDGFGNYLISVSNIIVPILLISGMIGNVFMVFFVVFMNAIILKMRFKVIPFKETFKMGAYMGTSLYILLILNGFFGMGMFMIILFLIVTFRQTNALSFEIMKRMKKQ